MTDQNTNLKIQKKIIFKSKPLRVHSEKQNNTQT